MRLRSGKVVTQIDKDKEMEEAAQTLLSFNKENIAKKHPLYQLCVNEKIKQAPKSLQENCGTCLRQIIEESVLKGINIKFEKQ